MQTEPDAPPGTLTGIMYSYPGGMEARSDFFIWLSPEAIVETFYYPEEPPEGVGWNEIFEKENVPITAGQWEEVEQVVLELYPLMEPKPEPRILSPRSPISIAWSMAFCSLETASGYSART